MISPINAGSNLPVGKLKEIYRVGSFRGAERMQDRSLRPSAGGR